MNQYIEIKRLQFLLFIGFPTFRKVNNVGDDIWTEVRVNPDGSRVVRVTPYDYTPTDLSDFFAEY